MEIVLTLYAHFVEVFYKIMSGDIYPEVIALTIVLLTPPFFYTQAKEGKVITNRVFRV